VAVPRTHYQISLTARQAVGLFVGLLLALGGAYFFGVMTGLSGRPTAPRTEVAARAETPGLDAVPPIETAVPTAAASASAGSRTELAAGATVATPGPADPSTWQPFDDGSSEEAASPTASAPGKVPAAPAARAPAPAALPGSFWVQVASLTSREQAGALSGRLSRRGFHAQLASAAGPKGSVYRVRVGPFRTEEEARRTAAKLAKQENIKSPWVVPGGR
jgi:cell division septation protein DedD